MSCTPLPFLSDYDDDMQYCVYEASPDGKYIARCNDFDVVEVFECDTKKCRVLKNLHPRWSNGVFTSICFMDNTTLLVSDPGMKRILEYTVLGAHVQSMFLTHEPYSVVSDGTHVVISVMGTSMLVVYDRHGTKLSAIDLSHKLRSKMMVLTKSKQASCVLVHDYIRKKVALVNYVTGEYVHDVCTGAAYYADVSDLGDVYTLAKYHARDYDGPIELRQWNTRHVVETCCQTNMRIVACAQDAKKLLVTSSDRTIHWWQPWHVTMRAAWLRVVCA